jgi:prolyl oligopeptidase
MKPFLTAALLSLMLPESPAAETAPAKPPVAPIREVTDTYHGTKIADPYRYMENLKDPEVVGWLKAQSTFAHGVLDRVPAKATLLKRIQELDKGAPYTVGGFHRLENGTLFYSKLVAGAETRVICSRPSLSGPETVILDPKSYETPGGPHASLEFFVPSPDGKYGLVGIAKGGSEVTTLFIRDLATGKDLPETIDRIETAYNEPSWFQGSGAFFYSRREKLPEGAPASDGYKNTNAYLHTVGSAVEQDPAFFGLKASRNLEFAPMDFPSVQYSPKRDAGMPRIVGQVHHGDAQELTLYSLMDELWEPSNGFRTGQPPLAWAKICDKADGVNSYEVHGDYIYLVTSKDAPRYKVVRTPLAKPDFAKAEVVLPESELVPTSVSSAKGALFVNATKDGSGVIVQLDPENKLPPKRLSLPHDLTGGIAEASPYFPEVFIDTAAWTKGGALYSFDPATQKFTPSDLQPLGAFDDLPGYTSKEVEVKSHDGVMVPLSIIYKEGAKLDGSHPLLLSGYGAYGSIRHVGFSPLNIAWLERGGIMAVAHVRGGGERGKLWHLGGQKATKPNTWKDLIACAEWLIAEKYTSTPKLGIQSGSAGGILIGRAITERPDLFKAAIIQVGVTDMLRFETTENGPPNVEEYGSVATREGFEALRAMSTLHQVQDGVKYPAVLLTHGLNDRRVDAWMSGKLTARLQAATGSANPILLLLDTDAGHGIGSTRTQIQQQLADKWSFLLWQFGDPEFQPAGK